MPVHEVDPLRDQRWSEFLGRQDRASIFHSREWLQALHECYGYQPVVFTTTQPGEPLGNGIVFCYVDSALTGRRLVSLPFSDHCDPLVGSPDELQNILLYAASKVRERGLRYVEFRPLHDQQCVVPGFSEYQQYKFHEVDLRPHADQLFQNLHNNSFRRKIHRAEREGLIYRVGATSEFIHQFYRLFVMTRRRHGLPPPPKKWIQKLVNLLGSALQIHLVFKATQPVAGMVTIKYSNTIVYKYGGSDLLNANLGGMALAFWMMMLGAKKEGIVTLDLGRCESDNNGLIRYKERLGSLMTSITYWRSPLRHTPLSGTDVWTKLAKQICAWSPDCVRIAAGNKLYRHFG
jgi:hypothetical protein